MPTSTRRSEPPAGERPSNSEPSTAPRRKWLLLGGALVIAAIGSAVAFWPRVDDKAKLDEQIETGWMKGREVVDALEFFEQGGVYENEDRPDALDIDQKYVIPLVKKLRDKHQLKVLAILREDIPNAAMAVIAEAPADRASRNAIRATILETVDEFPGFAWQNWSHRWVSLDFFDETEVVPFVESGALDRLQESQRRME